MTCRHMIGGERGQGARLLQAALLLLLLVLQLQQLLLSRAVGASHLHTHRFTVTRLLTHALAAWRNYHWHESLLQ